MTMLHSLIVLVLCAQPNAEEIRLIAHRGGVVDEQRIENNLPAIREAIQRGYWMLEVDIRESKDGRLVVHHDEDFKRFYDDSHKVAELDWDEIRRLKSRPGGLRPLEFGEFAAACGNKLRLMLDTKEPEHDPRFFASMLETLRQNGLLRNAFVIGTDQSRSYFLDKAKVGLDRTALNAAVNAGEDVKKRYFLFEHGRDLDEPTVRLAQGLGVPVVASVNVFHYPIADHKRQADADIQRLRKLGVTYFQIDSVYEPYCTYE